MGKNEEKKENKKENWILKTINIQSFWPMIIVIGVCIIGLITLQDSSKNKQGKEVFNDTDNIKTESISNNESENLEDKLENILAKIDGAGEVDAMITYESSEQIEPAFNLNATKEETTERDSQGGERTVTTSSENKTMITSTENKPVVIKTSEPKIKGVLVVSSGASNPEVKQKLYNAVQTALQVSGHQVLIESK